MPSVHICPTLDDYRKVYRHYDGKGYQFSANPEPIRHINYIKQEGYFFTRISKEEYEQLNNESHD